MGSVPKRRCARGQGCYHVRKLGSSEPVTLRASYEDEICERCRRAEADAELEAVKRRMTVVHEPVRFGDGSRAGRLKVLKRDLVARVLGRRGGFWEAVQTVRAYWRIDDPPLEQPPKSEDVLLPPALDDPENLPMLHEAWSNHPKLPPLAGVVWGDPKSYVVWPSDPHTAFSNLKRRWQHDLRWVLKHGVPEEHLGWDDPTEDLAPHVSPPVPMRELPWLRFASALVLHDVPVEEASSFADYGGKLVLGVLSERRMHRREIVSSEWRAYEEMVFEKAWELRSELGEMHLDKVKHEVARRYGSEIDEKLRELREASEREMELNPPRRYYVAFDPTEDTDEDMRRTLQAIREEAGLSGKGGGNKDQGDLLPVVCALVLQKPGWTPDLLAEDLKRSPNRVKELAGEGQKLLEGYASER